ncbi:proline-rich receptor-like protein kinase PERK2 [Triticum dicoccoides]|uniref:proline-rich receptor-like protein kinase PERK2 n=1 Tax=Triticum dicoccoides TaxID=85692 RepID=UPI00189095DE|nr:proline-rich receptor-like protein kinase PERK2 [Triticum dicoccoides]
MREKKINKKKKETTTHPHVVLPLPRSRIGSRRSTPPPLGGAPTPRPAVPSSSPASVAPEPFSLPPAGASPSRPRPALLPAAPASTPVHEDCRVCPAASSSSSRSACNTTGHRRHRHAPPKLTTASRAMASSSSPHAEDVVSAPRPPSLLLGLAPASPSGRRTSLVGFLRPPRALLCNNTMQPRS